MRFLIPAEEIGFSPQHIRILEDVFEKLQPQSGAQVSIFGSRARGAFRKYSDVDLLLAGFTAQEVQTLSELLEDSELPFVFDLVAAHHLAEAFRPQVEKEMRLLTKF